MIRCSECLLPDTRPDTILVDGVCTGCINFKNRPNIDWAERKNQLIAALERGKNSSGYDCIVPSSGGKDSTTQVLTLIELGARPLVVTATTCHLTKVGAANIANLARYATTIEITPNRTVRAKLNRLALEMVGDISWPEHVLIHRAPFKVAADLGIPVVFYGECSPNEYGGPLGSEKTQMMTQRWVSEYGGFCGLRSDDFIGLDVITELDMLEYAAPDPEKLKVAKVEAHFLGQYLPWDSRKNLRVSKDAGMIQELPCRANWFIGENLDNSQTQIHDFFKWLKFGFGRACDQVSIDIRNGRMTRPEGLAVVNERDGLFPDVYCGVTIDEMLDHISMSRDSFLSICNAFMNKDLFEEPALQWGQQLHLKRAA